MGYISSASTVYMDFHLTEAGRNVLVTGDLSQSIRTFALSDGDVDYRQPASSGHTTTAQGGYLPDVTGLHNSCTASINAGYTLNETTKPMLFVDVNALANTGGGTGGMTSTKQVVLGWDENGDGIQQHYSELEVEIYLHDYMVLQKHLMQAFPDTHRLLYEGQSGGTITPTIWKNAFKDAFVNFSSSTFDAGTLIKCLDAIKGMPGRGQFLDFYDSVHVKDGANLVGDSFRFSAQTDPHINNMVSFLQRQYITDQGMPGSGNIAGSGPSQLDHPNPYALRSQDEIGPTIQQTYPFQLSFSNLTNNLKGNGPGGLGYSTQGYGYLVLPGQSSFLQSIYENTAKYPTWSNAGFSPNNNYQTLDSSTGAITTYALGFVPSWLIENFNTDGGPLTLTNNNTIDVIAYANPVSTNNPTGTYDTVEYVIPTIRMRKPDQDYTSKNWYYPLPTPYLDGTIDIGYGASNMTYNSFASTSNTTMQLLSPGNYLSTWGVTLGNLEYVNETPNQSILDGATHFKPSTTSPPYSQTSTGISNGGRYYNFLSRMLIETDKMFSQLQSTSTVGNFGGTPTQMTEITQGTNSTGGTYYSGYTVGNGGQGISDRYIMTIPLSFKVFSENYPDALPATLNVKVVYSKEAVTQSIGYSAMTDNAGYNTPGDPINDNGESYWRPWDKIETKYYGERWSTLSDGSATNSDFTTDPSNSTMDVANGGNNQYKIFRNKIGGSPAL